MNTSRAKKRTAETSGKTLRRMPRMVEPIRDGETYSKELLRDRHGIGTRAWNRLVKAGMPVDRIGNRVFQRGEVIREWIARLAADKRSARASEERTPVTDGVTDG